MSQGTTHLPNSIMYYLDQLVSGAYFKMLAATIAVFFTEILHGNTTVFHIYMTLATIDLFLGICKSKTHNTYNPKYISHWIRKICTHLMVVFVLGMMCHSLFHTVGMTFSGVNWLLFCCTITEGASIVHNLRVLGCPTPPILDKIMLIIRKRAAFHIVGDVRDPHLLKEVEKVLGVPPEEVKFEGESCSIEPKSCGRSGESD